MTTNSYDIGDLVRVSVVFKNVADAATDPTNVSLKYRKPDGTVTTLVYLTDVALVKDSTGNYHADISATAAGVWTYKFLGTGAVQAVEEGRFFVQASVIP